MSTKDPRLDSVQYPGGVEVVLNTHNDRLVKEYEHIINTTGAHNKKSPLTLYFGDRGVELRNTNKLHNNGQRVDFLQIAISARNISKKQPLPKSIGSHKTVVDATAGFGMDSCRLALLGYKVVGIEQSPIISTMLRDGLWRAKQHKQTAKLLADNLSFVEMDALEYLKNSSGAEVIYIDPMFPSKNKKNALPPGHIQALQKVVGHANPTKTHNLFQAALATATSRVVIKRPTHAPTMGQNPISINEGKLVRYEVYKSQPNTH